MTPPPIPDLPGYEGKAFAKAAFFNFEIKPTWNDFLLAFGLAVFIQFTMSVLLTPRYGQGAFANILCPMPRMMVPLMNISPVQKKITRVAQCTGCRIGNNACPRVSTSARNFSFQRQGGRQWTHQVLRLHRCLR